MKKALPGRQAGGGALEFGLFGAPFALDNRNRRTYANPEVKRHTTRLRPMRQGGVGLEKMNQAQMFDVPLTDNEQRWISTAASGFALCGPVSAERISAPDPLSKCHIFRVTSGDERFALKVYPMGWWPDRLYRAHATAEFLKDNGFTAPHPLRTVAGDRVLFLGENPAICTTWVDGKPIWDLLAREWAPESRARKCLQSAMASLARFHLVMTDIPLEPTRPREFPPVAWYSMRLDETGAMGVDVGTSKILGRLSEILARNTFPEPPPSQHVLVDCHPGQFLFEDTVVTGIVDFDHVATAFPLRDLSKFLATDSSTLSLMPDLVSRYIVNRPLVQSERELLPAGVLRYTLTSAIQRIRKTPSDQSSVESECHALCADLAAFCRALPELKAVLQIAEAPGVPTNLELG